ncbi:MAG: CTP synthase [Treponema sp.]|nr:CTP synthase [Treponema sp.]
MKKFIFVSGGVCSGLGKGVSASSLGALLEGRGLNVRMMKCDPYINVDAGTMSPFEHGEVYVTDDGAETDLDLGNYARFTKGQLTRANSMTTGQVYESVMEQEREGRYLGKCVQVIPHITDEIKRRIMAVADADNDTDVVIIEIGGTVGDIESIPFLEAARQIIHERGRTNAISVHLTLINEVPGGELKTKPSQHSVKAMQGMGLQPDVLICRAPRILDEDTRRKLALFTNVDPDAVITSRDIDATMYEIPLMFFQQKLDQVVLRKMGVEFRHSNLKPWHSMMERFAARKGKVRIGMVGRYIDLNDAYKSVFEALFHAGVECGVEVEVVKIDSSGAGDAETGTPFDGTMRLDGILIPGGSDESGIDRIMRAVSWARANMVPCLGICLGMQIMVVEWCRNVIGWADADSTEFNRDTKHPVIEDPAGDANPGGAMRLGLGESVAEPGSHVFAAYGKAADSGGSVRFGERHRHRYEVSDRFRADIAASGLKITALTPDGSLVECVEWPNHPWGVGVQFHPEFKSKPTAAAPLFRNFVTAAKDFCLSRQEEQAE